MPAAALTDEQLLARDTRDVSVSLSAGAGCGKTHVLTQRFLSHLDPANQLGGDPTQLRQLIAITFTDAAAREMRSRIRQTCFDRLDDNTLPEETRNEWQRLLREIDTARVSTIHAFCTALLRTHAAEAGLDPTFGVLEQAEADMLLQETLDDVLRRRLSEHDADTLDLAAEFGRLAQLKDRLALLVDQRHRPAFQEWLVDKDDTNEEAARVDALVASWRAEYQRESPRLKVQAAAEKAPVSEMLRWLDVATPAAGNHKFTAAIATLRDLLPQLKTSPDKITDADLDNILENARVQTKCTKKDWPSDESFTAYKDCCTKLRGAITGAALPEFREDAARHAAAMGLKLLRLAGDVVDAYQRRKQQLSRLDFDDQLSLAHRLLSDPNHADLRDALSADLRLLLVDEFQDTDPLQVDLIKMICGPGFDEGRLFFVGDFKQSIYRFRGAAPPEFVKLRKAVDEKGQLQLTHNFRSVPGVLHFVNALFYESFGPTESLAPKRAAANDSPAVEFLWTIPQPKVSDDGHTIEKPSVEEARKQEAATVARRLRQLCDEACDETPIFDKDTKTLRRLKPGDIAILFRTLSDIRHYEDALRAAGLEYYLVGGHAFYAQQEIFDVLNLLRAVASSADEISLAGVLRSPFFALADESLLWLVERGDTLNGGLFGDSLPDKLSADEAPKVATAARTLRRLRAIKDSVPIAELLNEALDLTGYDAVVVAEFLGERKLANVQKLIEHARSADENHRDLNSFVTQLADFIAKPPKEPLASTSTEAADVVRLMTIHRAKGLEFPFVVVPDLSRAPQLDAPDAALDDELGPLVRIPNEDDDEKSATGMTLFAARERAAELDERKRLLYVACTRAADYLLLSTSIEALDEPKNDWMKLLAANFNLETGEFVGTLPDDYDRPRVHIAPPPPEQKPMSKSRGPDLLKLLDEAHELAASGQGIVPPAVGPIPADRSATRQFSFSRLSGRLIRRDRPRPAAGETSPDDDDDESAGATADLLTLFSGATAGLPSSAVLDTSRFSARSLGSLTHDVLARIDFAAKNVNAEIAAWCEHLAPQYVIQNAAEAARLATDFITRFAASPRGRQLAAAKILHREIDFLLAWPPDASATDRYITGDIDCLYQDAAGQWRIVDYKTNEIDDGQLEHIIRRYEMQLYVYAIAAEQSLGTSPTELILELLRPGIEKILPWNDEARARAIEMVNNAINAALKNPEPPVPNP